MKASEPALQGAVTVVISWLAARLGVLFFPVILLMIMMAVDYVTGMLAAKAEAIAHPENPEYGWSSRKGILGIIKKIAYIFLVVVLNEMLSVVENAGRMGAPVPPWLARCVASLKDMIDQEADKEADGHE